MGDDGVDKVKLRDGAIVTPDIMNALISPYVFKYSCRLINLKCILV